MFPDSERLTWFIQHAQQVIERCQRTVTCVPGVTDKPVTVCWGHDDPSDGPYYPSWWVRDAVMQCRSGFMDRDAMAMMARVIITFQNGPQRRELANGLYVHPWAVPDHINLPGLTRPGEEPGAVFFPGTYSSGDDQGDGSFGIRPPEDDT